MVSYQGTEGLKSFWITKSGHLVPSDIPVEYLGQKTMLGNYRIHYCTALWLLYGGEIEHTK